MSVKPHGSYLLSDWQIGFMEVMQTDSPTAYALYKYVCGQTRENIEPHEPGWLTNKHFRVLYQNALSYTLLYHADDTYFLVRVARQDFEQEYRRHRNMDPFEVAPFVVR